MLDKYEQNNLSQQNLAAWMRVVFAEALGKLTKAQTVRKSSGRLDEADDDALWDQATARAWKLLDENGMSARVSANNSASSPDLTLQEEHITSLMLESLARTLQSEGRICKNAAWFEGTTGQSAVSAYHLVQLRQAYIKAMAQAHCAMPHLNHGRDAAVQSIFDDTLSRIIADEAMTYNYGGNLERIAAQAAPQPRLHEANRSPVATCAEDVISLTPTKVDPFLPAIAERLMADKRDQELREATVVQYGLLICTQN
ncbi:hypothetical protein GZH79_06910 [Loktanella sp. SALINAS62]|nr:hypothetical protein [Loktanella sp. SALINAS62]MBS1302072.1 hypothetical protein [Loktanella sp. SALINAS62]